MKKSIGLFEAMLPLVTMVVCLVGGSLFFPMSSELLVIVMLISAVVAGVIAIRHGHDWVDIQRSTGQKVASVLPALLILLSIGMLIGINYFFYSILTTITLLILFWLIRVNKFQTKLKSHRIYIKCSNYKDIQSTLEFIHRLNCKITNKKIEKKTDSMELTITYQTSALANHRILSNISKLSSVQTFSQV